MPAPAAVLELGEQDAAVGSGFAGGREQVGVGRGGLGDDVEAPVERVGVGATHERGAQPGGIQLAPHGRGVDGRALRFGFGGHPHSLGWAAKRTRR